MQTRVRVTRADGGPALIPHTPVFWICAPDVPIILLDFLIWNLPMGNSISGLEESQVQQRCAGHYVLWYIYFVPITLAFGDAILVSRIRQRWCGICVLLLFCCLLFVSVFLIVCLFVSFELFWGRGEANHCWWDQRNRKYYELAGLLTIEDTAQDVHAQRLRQRSPSGSNYNYSLSYTEIG